MFVTQNNDAEVKKWRDKYLELADQQDAFEKATKNQHQQLNRAVLMVSLLAEGQSESLDPKIKQLRSSAKKGESLSKPLTELESSVKTFEQKQQAQAKALSLLLQESLDELLKCELSSNLKSQIKEIKKQIRYDLESYSGYINQLNLWVELINAIADEKLEKSTSITDKLKGLFRADEQDDSSADEEEFASSTQAPASLPQNTQDTGSVNIINNVSQILKNLLGQLILSDSVQPLATSLKARLKSTLQSSDIPLLLQEASQLVLKHITGTQKEVKEYLEQLDERLSMLYKLLSSADDHRSVRSNGYNNFHDAMSVQVDDIKAIVKGSGELGELSERVVEHLNKLTTTLENFKQEENESEAELKKQLGVLKNKVSEMEKEASQVRTQLAEHHYKATHDSLTGMPNRQAYDERMESEYNRYKRYQSPLSLVVCDVDFFKKINDSYGHLAGDKMLQMIARMLQKNIRDTDFISRIGGEEFTIILPETQLDKAMILANKIRQKVEKTPFHYKEQRIPVTMSFGLSAFKEDDLINDVFERADKALYMAKDSGRNNCQSL